MNTTSLVAASLIACSSLTSAIAGADPSPARAPSTSSGVTPKALPGKTNTTSASLATAPAADAPASNASSDEDEKHLRGLELVLRPSFGGAGGGSPVRYAPAGNAGLQGGDPGAIVSGTSSPYGSGFVGQAMIGYRVHPLVSAGVRGGFRNASASPVNDGTTGLSRTSWDAGFYARMYPLALTPSVRKHLDPWVGVGVGYMRDTQTFKKSVANVSNVDFTLDDHAVAVPLGVGVDYRVLPLLSVGPSFEYTLANSVAGCMKASVPGTSTSYCSSEDPGKQFMKADNYGVWTAGLDVRATF